MLCLFDSVSIYVPALLLTFLLYCLFFTVIIAYCFIEQSFGCCDTNPVICYVLMPI